jgi:hypothetical protein
MGKMVVKSLNQAANQLKIYDIKNPTETAKLIHEVELPGRGSIDDES